MVEVTKKFVSFSDYIEYKEYNLTWSERYEKYHHYSNTIIIYLKNSKKKYKKYNLTWQERHEKYHHSSKTIIKYFKNSKKKKKYHYSKIIIKYLKNSKKKVNLIMGKTKKSVSFSGYIEYKEYNLTWQERYEKYHHSSKIIIKYLKNSKKKYKTIVKGLQEKDIFFYKKKRKRNLLDNEQSNIKKMKF
tara:strand:- start:932 stop:1495 length:564 start_codon:yes stop_codon:yes gene_type:complete